MTLTDLKAKLDSLSPAKIRFVANVVDALATPPRARIQKRGTWITGVPDWIEYFGLALSVHHGATPEPLGLTSFETVFRNACRSVGWHTDKPGSATRRFWDMEVTPDPHSVPLRLSLKSTAAKRLSERSAHISKLTEAAWIQDTRTPRARRDRLQNLFQDYRKAVDAIIMLRAFRDRSGTPGRYQLLEIPTTIFAPIQDAALDAFQRDAPVIDCCDSTGKSVAAVAVDRSDAKITVRRILLSACTVHAEWIKSP